VPQEQRTGIPRADEARGVNKAHFANFVRTYGLWVSGHVGKASPLKGRGAGFRVQL